MATSTSTVLDVLNKVLSNVGERRVRALNTPMAQLAFDSIVEAIRELNLTDDWEFTRSYFTALDAAWTLNTFTHNLSRVRGVSYGDTTNGYGALAFIDRLEFDEVPLQTGTPQWYTISDDSTISVNPYPTTAPERAKLRVYGVSSIAVPSLLTDTFNVPEEATTLIVKLASSLFAQRHANDAQAAQQYRYDYETVAQRWRVQKQATPYSSTNMFRRRRNYGI